ncbi:unnamed protein product [Rodentolepis nana]|uniref:Uncharacterized protein n=1 Tax=Rodentolepis nana TaxID=102285 RepID=A0A0R3TX90_RODNA|nr:unnamed protein product [Rodentolepis nana]
MKGRKQVRFEISANVCVNISFSSTMICIIGFPTLSHPQIGDASIENTINSSRQGRYLRFAPIDSGFSMADATFHFTTPECQKMLLALDIFCLVDSAYILFRQN